MPSKQVVRPTTTSMAIPDRHVLLDIFKIAQDIQSLCNSPSSSKSSNSDILTNCPQLISSAISIAPQLQEIGLSSVFAEEVSNTYLRACNDLRATCEASLRKAVESSKASITTKTVQDMVQIWSTIHSQQTRTWAESAFSRARESVANAQSRITRQAKRPSFNYEYTPLLEKYFEYNAYPSAPDRAVLARKSMMTPRQIEVWFQNHRNRAKKEGRPLRRLSCDPLPLELSLQSLEQKMPFFTVPESERKVTIESDASESDTSDEEDIVIGTEYSQSTSAGGDVIATTSPPHAFPVTYPLSCSYTPFPCKSGKSTFPAPIWSRKAATSLRTRPIGDFDDFVEDFHIKLQFRETPSRKGGRRNHSPSTNTLQPWFTATHTFAPQAPHPAFIRPSSVHVMSGCPSPISAVPAPSSRLHPFRSPSPCSSPTSLVPPTQISRSRRKVACLPKRSPTRQSMAHRGVSPTASEASLSPSSRSYFSSSRTSSAGSDSLANRRPSSSSSSSSSCSTLTTPELLPTMLPEHAQSPVTVAGVDFQDLDDLFDEPLNTISPDEGLQLSFPGDALGIHQKQPFRFCLELPSPDRARECPS